MFAAINIIVKGKVHGVFFRAGTQERAKALGLDGWVSNREDGSVEILAQGEQEKLEQLLEWCYSGPDGAEVKELIFRWIEVDAGSSEIRSSGSFEIKKEE